MRVAWLTHIRPGFVTVRAARPTPPLWLCVWCLSPGLSVTHAPGVSRSFHFDWADWLERRSLYEHAEIVYYRGHYEGLLSLGGRGFRHPNGHRKQMPKQLSAPSTSRNSPT